MGEGGLSHRVVVCRSEPVPVTRRRVFGGRVPLIKRASKAKGLNTHKDSKWVVGNV